jgi:spore maturation protein CgeB
MKQKLGIRIFAHSWVSDWNHGNAHFLRGLARELMRQGHELRCYEEAGGWSLTNLMQEGEIAKVSIASFRRTYPELDVRFYRAGDGLASFLDEELAGADLVLLHEWNEPGLISEVLARRPRFGFRALFLDTHHRALSSPEALRRLPLEAFDGVLAFGETIRRIYRERFGVERVWTFHEAADPSVFYPRPLPKENDLLWIGNWGDEERTEELHEFLISPARALTASGRRVRVYGVRYPEPAKALLRQAGIEYAGYLPNLAAPEVYAHSRVALHVPRRQYADGLSGIPTIRVFEALACGVPLVCSPWSDSEGLFRPGKDYFVAGDGGEMQAILVQLLADDNARRQLAASGLESIRQHHTCSHRAAELTRIYGELRG